MRNPDEHGRCHRTEGFNLAQRHFEGVDLAADFFNGFARGSFAALEGARRKNADVGLKMKPLRVKLAAQSLNKFPDWIFEIRHQRVAGLNH
jgi:hypothetical protein